MTKKNVFTDFSLLFFLLMVGQTKLDCILQQGTHFSVKKPFLFVTEIS